MMNYAGEQCCSILVALIDYCEKEIQQSYACMIKPYAMHISYHRSYAVSNGPRDNLERMLLIVFNAFSLIGSPRTIHNQPALTITNMLLNVICIVWGMGMGVYLSKYKRPSVP